MPTLTASALDANAETRVSGRRNLALNDLFWRFRALRIEAGGGGGATRIVIHSVATVALDLREVGRHFQLGAGALGLAGALVVDLLRFKHVTD